MTVIPLLRRRRAPQCYIECTARFQGKCLCTAPQAGSQNCITCQNSAGKQKHTAKKEKKIIHRNPAFCAPAAPRGAPRQNSDEKNTRKGRKRKEGESLTQKIPPLLFLLPLLVDTRVGFPGSGGALPRRRRRKRGSRGTSSRGGGGKVIRK